MILKSLSPVSFGRFQNLSIGLAPGVNLIEAPNEAGKSTLAAFISGMLYGFFKRDVKKRIYAPAFERYLPWDSPNRYLGAMDLTHEGAAWRLERNFLKDDVKLIDASTGRDESERMPYNPSLRIREPGLHFLGISQTAFEGTLYVPQQAVRADDGLGAELSDRIDALSEAGAGGLSATGAVKWLDARRAELGTVRRSGSPLGEQQQRLAALMAEREDAAGRRARAAENAKRERALTLEIEALEAAQRADEAALDQAKRFARWKRAEAARACRERIAELETSLCALPGNGGPDESALETAIAAAHRIEEQDRQADALRKALSELDVEIASARAKAEATGFDEEARRLSDALERSDARMTLLEEDLDARRRAEESIRRSMPTAPALEAPRARALIARYEALPAPQTARAATALGLIILALALLGLRYPAAFALAVPAAIFLALGIARNRRYRIITQERADILSTLGVPSADRFDALLSALDERACAERALDTARGALAEAESALEDATREFSRLLDQAGKDSLTGYRDALARYDAALADERALFGRRLMLARQLADAEAQTAEQAELVRRTLSEAGLEADRSAAAEALDGHLKQTRARREIARALDGERRLLAERLGGEDYDLLTANARPEAEPAHPAEFTAFEIERRAALLMEKKIDLGRCAAEREAIENGCRTLPDIDGEIALAQEKLDALNEQAAAIERAKARIEVAAAAMRKKLSPALGRSIAQVSRHVTSGRYERLYIDTDLVVRAEAAGQTVSPDRLSGGTADALYLAVRLGLIEFLMGDRACPVILDDSFAQMDDGRAERMLQVVAAFAEGRQALLLTCQSRTRRMLESLHIPHNAVEL